MPGDLAEGTGWTDSGRFVVAACGLAYLPFTLLGYGTDIDVANILRSGGGFVRDGHYDPSRRPGSIVHEIATGLLDRVGGSVAVNLAGVVLAALLLWSVAWLARDDGQRWPAWTALVVAANPWFWMAATSLGDFVWAIALALGGTVAARRDRRVLAGVLFGLSLGCRLSTILVVAAWLVAERFGERDGRPSWRASATTGAVLGAVGVAMFLPAWFDAGRSLDFLRYQPGFDGWRLHLGRWAVKNAAVIGLPACLVLLAGLGRGWQALTVWRRSVLVRFAVLVAVLAEVLFFRLPLKPVHLLPVVVAIALLAGASAAPNRRWLAALVTAELLGGVVATTIGEPDVPHHARSGQLVVRVAEGPLLNDVRCRLADRRDGPWPDPVDPIEFPPASSRAALLFDCQSETWKVLPPSR